MRSPKILLILICLFVVSQISFGQAKPQAVLFDEMGNPNCEDLAARTNGFLTQLNNEPNSQGYAVFYGDNKYLRRKLGLELWLNGEIKSMRFNSSRIIKIRSAETGGIRIQFWIVPAGVEKPSFNETRWNFVFPQKTKPFIFHDDYSDQICFYISFEKVFAEYLNANPEARGHIVIHEESLKKYEKRKKETQNLLSEIPKRRLKYFYVKNDSSNVEFWLVPKKQK
jgi:hypothetical protein